MTNREFFNWLFAEVKSTDIWAGMAGTVEDSPWHREANVAVHTELVVQAAQSQMVGEDYSDSELTTLIGALFHDFGKPEAEEELEKESEPGVMYRRYAGHEVISAAEFFEFLLTHENILNSLIDRGFTWDRLRAIRFMIEYHLPYGLKDKHKLSNLKNNLVTFGVEESFYAMLLADCRGRISDDHETKIQNVINWITEFRNVEIVQDPGIIRRDRVNQKLKREKAPILYLMFGVAGCGKTTFTQQYLPDVKVFSEDDLRLLYAAKHMTDEEYDSWKSHSLKGQYDVAWKFCHMNDDSKYDQFAREKFQEALDLGESIVLDRTNQSRKARSFWIQAARQKGYDVHSVEFYIPLSTLIARQSTRPEKAVPEYRVRDMHHGMQLPLVNSEVDVYNIVY